VRAGADGYAERWLDGSTSAALPPLPLWPEGRVAGVVRDPAGAPVEGALVSVTVRAGWPDAVTRSGANGTYELRGLPAGVYQPRASAPGLVGRAATTVLLTVGERAGELDVATATAGQLRGRAWIGAAGQAPCGDCTLMLTTAGGGYVEAVADDDGVVALEAVPVGTHGGYLASATQGGRTLDPIVVSTGTATSLDWTLPPAGVVVGSVVDKHGPRPLEIAAVHANAGDAAEAGLLVARTGVTSSGAFTLGALPAGRYQVLVGRGEALLGPPQTVEVVVGGTGPASLALVADVPSPTPSTEPELLVGCPRHPRSRGTVRDAAGAPVPGVLVWSGPAALDAGCGASGAVARTSATGAFELGAGDELVEAVLLGDATGRRARALTAGHDLALVEPAMLHGQVTRAGAPATACALTLAGVERRINVDVTCAADGSFHVRGLPPDEYAVLDGTPGRVLTTTTLAPGAAGKLSIELPPPP
jgi:hypothetical protein